MLFWRFVASLMVDFTNALMGAWVMGVYHLYPHAYWERVGLLFVTFMVITSTIGSSIRGGLTEIE